jgi:hypothetical protein
MRLANFAFSAGGALARFVQDTDRSVSFGFREKTT